MRCLVIEDEADTARYISNGLREAGHTPALVRDGVGGLHLATNEERDIIILDRRHCQLKQGWYPPAVGGAAVRCREAPIADALRKAGSPEE